MSILRADSIRDRAGTGAPDFPNGLTGNVTGNADTATALSGTPNIAVGTVTGTDATFSGNLTVNGTTTTIDTAITSVDSLSVDGNINSGGDVSVDLIRSNTLSNSASNGTYFKNKNAAGGGVTAVGIVETGLRVGDFSSSLSAAESIKLGTDGGASFTGEVGIGSLLPSSTDATLAIKAANADIKLGNPTGHYFRFKCLSTGEFTINDNDVAERLRITSSGTAIFKAGLAEKYNKGTTLAAASNDIALGSGNVHRFTSNESGAKTVNFTGVHATLADGESVSFTVILTPNNSGYINAATVDGVTPSGGLKWSGGSTPGASDAGASGRDVYTFTIFKDGTATNSYEIFGALSNYA